MNTTRVALAGRWQPRWRTRSTASWFTATCWPAGSPHSRRCFARPKPASPDYGILNISAQLAVFMALAGLGEWLLVGGVIGLVYKRPGV